MHCWFPHLGAEILNAAILFSALTSANAQSQRIEPDCVLINGKIFTSDTAHPYGQALAIKGEREFWRSGRQGRNIPPRSAGDNPDRTCKDA